MAGKDKTSRVQEFLSRHDLDIKVVEFDQSTRTAADAAAAVGCAVGQIVKSLVFRSGDKPLLFLVSGVNRVNLKLLQPMFEKKLKIADADFTREHTGYAIGGVPPAAHDEVLETFIDEALLNHETVWAAAGTPHAVFRIKSRELLRLTGAKVITVI